MSLINQREKSKLIAVVSDLQSEDLNYRFMRPSVGIKSYFSVGDNDVPPISEYGFENVGEMRAVLEKFFQSRNMEQLIPAVLPAAVATFTPPVSRTDETVSRQVSEFIYEF